jgi:hypothetical protein
MTKERVPAPPSFGRLAEILYALDEPNWLPMLQDAMRTSLPGSLAEAPPPEKVPMGKPSREEGSGACRVVAGSFISTSLRSPK